MDCAIIFCISELYFIVLPACCICVCGYDIVAPLCVVFEISLHFDAMTIKSLNLNLNMLNIYDQKS